MYLRPTVSQLRPYRELARLHGEERARPHRDLRDHEAGIAAHETVELDELVGVGEEESGWAS
jgi:hypothetical protein